MSVTAPAESTAPPAVLAAWQRVTERWDDTGAHDALVALVIQHGCFAWAAARYKAHAQDEVATRQLERVRKAALATMLTARKPGLDARSPYHATLRLFGVLVVVLLIALLSAMLVRSRPRRAAHDREAGTGDASEAEPAATPAVPERHLHIEHNPRLQP